MMGRGCRFVLIVKVQIQSAGQSGEREQVIIQVVALKR